MASSSGHNILIATHTFPPAGGIGGRRWAKFAKYLRRGGAEVQVLSAKLAEHGSPWTDDVDWIALNTYQHRFPHILTQQPRNALQKLRYRFALSANMRVSKGSPYDRALFDEHPFVTTLAQMLRRAKVGTLVVSAAPFRLPWYALKLRPEFPHVRFVVDFRDPWTSGSSFGYQSISSKRKAFEAAAEAAVVKGFDLVTTPWPSLVDELRLKYPQRATRIHCLPHCFDPDDLQSVAPRSSYNIPPHVVYGGNLYQGLDALYESLAKASSRGEVQVDMWASSSLPGMNAWANEHFRLHSPVSSKAFFAEAIQADALLFPIPASLRNGLPTKLLEYAATGLPLLALGHSGSLSQMLCSKGLGVFHDIDTGAPNWQQMLTSGRGLKADRAWIDAHEASAVTASLIHLIESTTYEH